MPEAVRVSVLGELGAGISGPVHLLRVNGDFAVSKPQDAKQEPTPARQGGKKVPVHEYPAEAALLARLQHVNVVRLQSVFQHKENGKKHTFLFLEFCNAGDLSQALDFKLSDNLLHVLLYQLTSALIYIHGENVVHRDIKPANIFLHYDHELVAKLGDFGASRGAKLCTTQIGTPLYMAPEQLSGEPYGPPADVWGLCATFSHLFCQAPPFNAKFYGALVMKIFDSEPEPLPVHLDVNLSQAIMAGLAKCSTARPSSAAIHAAVRVEFSAAEAEEFCRSFFREKKLFEERAILTSRSLSLPSNIDISWRNDSFLGASDEDSGATNVLTGTSCVMGNTIAQLTDTFSDMNHTLASLNKTNLGSCCNPLNKYTFIGSQNSIASVFIDENGQRGSLIPFLSETLTNDSESPSCGSTTYCTNTMTSTNRGVLKSGGCEKKRTGSVRMNSIPDIHETLNRFSSVTIPKNRTPNSPVKAIEKVTEFPVNYSYLKIPKKTKETNLAQTMLPKNIASKDIVKDDFADNHKIYDKEKPELPGKNSLNRFSSTYSQPSNAKGIRGGKKKYMSSSHVIPRKCQLDCRPTSKEYLIPIKIQNEYSSSSPEKYPIREKRKNYSLEIEILLRKIIEQPEGISVLTNLFCNIFSPKDGISTLKSVLQTAKSEFYKAALESQKCYSKSFAHCKTNKRRSKSYFSGARTESVPISRKHKNRRGNSANSDIDFDSSEGDWQEELDAVKKIRHKNDNIFGSYGYKYNKNIIYSRHSDSSTSDLCDSPERVDSRSTSRQFLRHF